MDELEEERVAEGKRMIAGSKGKKKKETKLGVEQEGGSGGSGEEKVRGGVGGRRVGKVGSGSVFCDMASSAGQSQAKALTVKEPYVSAKETYVSTKEPYCDMASSAGLQKSHISPQKRPT